MDAGLDGTLRTCLLAIIRPEAKTTHAAAVSAKARGRCVASFWRAPQRPTQACQVTGTPRPGPDAPGVTRHETDRCGHTYAVHASVLALRGHEIVGQPMRSDDGRLLFLWNGEVFEAGVAFAYDEHDGKQLFALLQDAVSKQIREGHDRATSIETAFNETLSAIDGPFAAVLLDLDTGTLLYGRDTLGRRSLLFSQHEEHVILVSAACREMVGDIVLNEVPCESFWSLSGSQPRKVLRRDTKYTRRAILHDINDFAATGRDNIQSAQAQFLNILSESVRVRVQGTRLSPASSDAEADVAVLFSGGLDCTTIALLAHKHLPADEAIDLLNVAFENPRTLQGQKAAEPVADDTATVASEKNEHALRYDVPDRKTGISSFAELRRLAPTRRWRFVSVNVPFAEYTAARPAIEALLYPNSSVMDLSIGAALYFASHGTGIIHDGSSKDDDQSTNTYRSPARVLLSGLGADELLGGYTRHRRAWERGRLSSEDPEADPHVAEPHVTGKKAALIAELQLDLDRLPTRNLGRDDRVLSDSGREARYPFLARSVIDFLASLPVECKMHLDAPPGTGDKALLRRVAAEHLGLERAAALTKRAIQFGARSAKMDVGNGRTKGQDSFRNGGT